MTEKELTNCLEVGERERRLSLTKDEILDELYNYLGRTIDSIRELDSAKIKAGGLLSTWTSPEAVAGIKMFMTIIKTYKAED